MGQSSGNEPAARARRILRKLLRAHPDATIALQYRNPFELLCATVLSAQCTDERVNRVTPELFRRYPDAPSLARARPAEVERIIKPTGFYKAKARSLIGIARALTQRYHGRVPDNMEDLVTLPGVGRKTANVILGNAYGVPGIVVDTHVGRVARRLGLTRNTDPVKIEQDLMRLIPRKDWIRFSHAMIFHGRRICKARRPQCGCCPIAEDCDFARAERRG